jgi:nucleoside-diphosphate-sugar epimerase
MKVFVTGAKGFIGGALAERLARDGHQVTGLARRPEHVSAHSNPRYVCGDLASEGGLDAARPFLEDADLVAHLAAVRKDRSVRADRLRHINVASGPRLLELARNARLLLFVSSVAVYGHSDGRPIDESFAFAPTKRYGASKVAAERAIRAAEARTTTSVTIVRPGIVYGPGDTYGMVANVARLLFRRRFLLVGRGTSRLSPLYVDDLVEGLASALLSPTAAGRDFILAGSEAVTVRRLVEVIGALVGRSPPRIYVPEWSARLGAWILEKGYRTLRNRGEPFLTREKVDLFTRDDLYDTERARTALGFRPRVDFEEGARRAVGWLRAAGRLERC